MQTELRQARNILTDLTDEVAQQIFDINDLQTECRGLQGQIVQSPERIKREIGTCPRPDARAYAWMLPGPCGTAPPVAPLPSGDKCYLCPECVLFVPRIIFVHYVSFYCI